VTAALYDVVVPTVGRASLAELVAALAAGRGPAPGALVVVDDRPCVRLGRELPAFAWPGVPVRVIPTGGRGPAAARNAGALYTSAPWIAFLDDDVLPDPGWKEDLARDLAELPPGVAASLGAVGVPPPSGRRPTDQERSVLRLASAAWISADVAIRRSAFEALGGFDERFPRAYREDTDLQLRLAAARYRTARGARRSTHLLRSGSSWASLAAQRGNADDVLLAALHGRDWRARTGEAPSLLPRHVASVAAAAAALLAAAVGAAALALAALAAWAALTAAFFWRRVARGTRTAREIAAMAGTSVAIPFAAAAWHLRGRIRVARLRRAGPLGWIPPSRRPLRAALFDRDGTLIEDVPGNKDCARVRPCPGARRALHRLRLAGVRIAVVTNQAGVAEGAFDAGDVERVNRRVQALLGPIEGFFVCPHGRTDGCGCRKPEPGLVREALAKLDVDPAECVLVGDTGADVDAARAAGVRAILVPNRVTRMEEVHAAPEVARDVDAAALRALGVDA